MISYSDESLSLSNIARRHKFRYTPNTLVIPHVSLYPDEFR